MDQQVSVWGEWLRGVKWDLCSPLSRQMSWKMRGGEAHPLSQDLLHSSFGSSLSLSPLDPWGLNTAAMYEFNRVLKQADDLSPCHSLFTLSNPDLTSLDWQSQTSLGPSFKLNLLSAPLKACFTGGGLVDSFKPHILSLMLQSAECWRIMASLCCHYAEWLKEAVIGSRWWSSGSVLESWARWSIESKSTHRAVNVLLLETTLCDVWWIIFLYEGCIKVYKILTCL